MTGAVVSQDDLGVWACERGILRVEPARSTAVREATSSPGVTVHGLQKC